MLKELGYKIYLTAINFWSWWWEIDNEQDTLARTILTIFVPILIFVFYNWMSSNSRKYSTPLPPGPYGLPVVGYLPFLGSNLPEIFTQMTHSYGPIFSIWLGSKLHVVVNSKDLVKVVACEQDRSFANRNPPITAQTITFGGSDIAWSDNNAHWRKMRKLLATQVLSNENLDACKHYRTQEVRKTIKGIYARIETKVDINKIAFDTEVNVVTSMLWGSSKSRDGNDSGHIGDGFREVEYRITELLGKPNISDFIPILSWFDLQGRLGEMKQLQKHLFGIFDNLIKERNCWSKSDL